MKVLVLGVDGYLGWPTALRFASLGHDVTGIDSYEKREWEAACGVRPLERTPEAVARVRRLPEKYRDRIQFRLVDIAEPGEVAKVLKDVRPDVIIHMAEQPSAPFSMMGAGTAALTQKNNVIGTLNLLWAMHAHCPDAHLLKLGTMGEYGTPNIDIEEGWLDVEHKGRSDRVLFPKKPGSFYHLSKVHDSHNIEFACRAWGLRATDLNQGVVYGVTTPELEETDSRTSFHYDAVFGTALNRFVVQAVVGEPITVYGNGTQQRAFLDIRDTMQCVELAAATAPKRGEFRVLNQFTEAHTIKSLAQLTGKLAKDFGLSGEVVHLDNPRVEEEDHYFNPQNEGFKRLGLEPHLLETALVSSMFEYVSKRADNVDRKSLRPRVSWKQ